MGLGNFLSRKPSRKSRDSGVYYYNSAGSQTYDSRYSTPDSNKSAAYHAATAAAGATSRNNSMTSLSGAAAQAALKRHSSTSSLYNNKGIGIQQSYNNGRTMSLSSRTFRSPNPNGSTSNILRSNSYQGSRNPYLQQKQKQHLQQQSVYRPNSSRLSSLTSNSARPYSRTNSMSSNSSRFSTGGTKTTTTTTTRTTSHTPDGQAYTTIVKTTKEKDFDGRTRSITKTTIQQRGDLEIVKKTVIKPTQYVGSIVEESEPINPEDETFDDDFYQEPEVEQDFLSEDHLEDIKEEPSHIYDDHLYDVYLEQTVSPERETFNPRNNTRNVVYSNLPSESKVPELQLPVSPTPNHSTLQDSRSRHSYHMLTRPQQVTSNRLERPPVLSQSSSSTSSPRSILKSSPVRVPIAPPPVEVNNGDEDEDEDDNEKFCDAVQSIKRKSTGQNIHNTDSAESSERVTEDTPSNSSSSCIPPSGTIANNSNYRSSMKQYTPNNNKPALLPAFNARSNSLTSNTSSVKKQVKIASEPRSTYVRSSSNEPAPQQPHKKPSEQEMYELAYKAAMKRVYGDRNTVQAKTQQYGEPVQQSQTQYPVGDDTIEVELDEDTQRNTLMNTGSRSMSLNSRSKTTGRTLSLSSHTSSSHFASTPGYQSNAAGVGFVSHSLRDIPDQKTLKKQKVKQAKEQEKAEAKTKKQLEKQRKEGLKRLAKERSEAVKKAEENQLQEQQSFTAAATLEAHHTAQLEQASGSSSPVINHSTPDTTPASSIPVETAKPRNHAYESPQNSRVASSTNHTLQASPSTTSSSRKKSRKLFGFSRKSNKSSPSPTNNPRSSNDITVALPIEGHLNAASVNKLPPSLASNPDSVEFVRDMNTKESQLRKAGVQGGDGVIPGHKTKGRKFMEFFNL